MQWLTLQVVCQQHHPATVHDMLLLKISGQAEVSLLHPLTRASKACAVATPLCVKSTWTSLMSWLLVVKTDCSGLKCCLCTVR